MGLKSSIEALVEASVNSELCVVAPPPSAETWERFDLVCPDIVIPDEVRDLYALGNGFASGYFHPIGGRWLPLPTEPPPLAVSFVAPCRPEAQLPIISYGSSYVVLLLDGEHQGELWAVTPYPDSLGRSGRVAPNLEHLFADLVSAAVGNENVILVSDAQSSERYFPGINGFLIGGTDYRSISEIKADGGWPPIYVDETSPEHEAAWYELEDRATEWYEFRMRWHQEHRP